MAFSASPTAPPARRPGVHRGLGGDTARTADPSWPKGHPMPYDAVLSNNSWGEEEEGGTFRVTSSAFPSHHYVWWSSAFLETAEHLPADGRWWMNSSLCSACTCSFALPIKLSLSQPRSFLTFTLPVLSPIPPRGREQGSGCAGPSCQLGLTHNISKWQNDSLW